MNRKYYLLAVGQPNDRAIYYTGENDFHGGEVWGNVFDAHKFDTLSEIFSQIEKEGCTASPIIVQVYEYTWDIIRQGMIDFNNGVKSNEREVMHKYNTISYITNSK